MSDQTHTYKLEDVVRLTIDKRRIDWDVTNQRIIEMVALWLPNGRPSEIAGTAGSIMTTVRKLVKRIGAGHVRTYLLSNPKEN